MFETHEPAQTPWRRGAFKAMPHQLVFGQTYEDAAIELGAIAPGSRVFSIAGAGYTARALAAAGHRVTAVDISAVQLAYAQTLEGGSPPRTGLVERVLGAGRKLAALCGWTRQKLDVFLQLSSTKEQVEYWDRELDTPTWRVAVDTLLAPRLLRLCYRGPLVASVPRGFGPLIRGRLRRGWASHWNQSHPFAALLLLGKPVEPSGTPKAPIRYVCADAADFLKGCAPRSFDAFALSNLGDGASPEYWQRLAAAMAHAGNPQAQVIWRSFAEPVAGMDGNRAARDRSLLWGIVGVSPVSNLCGGGMPCGLG